MSGAHPLSSAFFSKIGITVWYHYHPYTLVRKTTSIPAGNGTFDIFELEFAEREDALDDEMRQLHLEQSCVAQKLPLYEDDLEDVYATAERVGCSAMQFVDLSVEYFELIASTQEPAWLTNGHDNLILSNDIF